jgi:hypothetical protein
MRFRCLVIVLAILPAFASDSWGQSKEPPKQAPEIKTEQRPNGGLKTEPNAEADKQAATPTPTTIPEVSREGPNRKCGAHCPDAEQEGTEFWPPFYGYRLKITDTLVAAFTALLFVATFALWWSTRRLVKGADRNAQLELRAYISVRPRAAIDVYAERVGRVDFLIQNNGKTPAYNVRYIAMAEVLDFPLVDSQGDLVAINPSQTIPSQPVHSGHHIIGETSTEAPISMEDFRAMVGPDRRYYVAGIVVYDDIFGIERRTKFCAYLGGPEYEALALRAFTQRVPVGEVEWTFSHVHNEAT